MFLDAVVEVGFLPLNSTVMENETFSVCVELTAGALEREITVPLLVEPGSASGIYVKKCMLDCRNMISFY